MSGRVDYQSCDIPPVRIHPFEDIQVVDLRAIRDRGKALGVGLRVAIEMIRAIAPPHARAFIFSPEATEMLIGVYVGMRKAYAIEMRAHLPRRAERETADPKPARGEVLILIPPDDVARAEAPLAAAGLLVGSDADGTFATLGPPTTETGYTILLPPSAPDLCAVEGVRGIGMRWDGELLLDLRRMASGSDFDLATAFLAASFAIKDLAPFKTRTWIIAPWILGPAPAAAFANAATHARSAIALHRPKHDRVVFDGAPTPELIAWVKEQGLEIFDQPYALTSTISLPYPELAQNFMLDYAVGGK